MTLTQVRAGRVLRPRPVPPSGQVEMSSSGGLILGAQPTPPRVEVELPKPQEQQPLQKKKPRKPQAMAKPRQGPVPCNYLAFGIGGHKEASLITAWMTPSTLSFTMLKQNRGDQVPSDEKDILYNEMCKSWNFQKAKLPSEVQKFYNCIARNTRENL